MSRPRILFIDAYDSFSNNIVSLLTTVLDAEVDILPIDPPHLDPKHPGFTDDLKNTLRRYDVVVCGPGPGSPVSAQDVGLMRYIWELEGADLLPVLGICLGFQSLVVHLGGVVKKLTTGLHGMIREIDHSSERRSLHEGNIFSGVAPFRATLYHSLHADIGQEAISASDWPKQKWSIRLPDIVPLAWTYEDRGDSIERILMGVKHGTKPFWGLQYHPESICTEPAGHDVIKNWFSEAMRWNRDSGRRTESTPYQTGGPTKLRRLSTRDVEDCRDLRDYHPKDSGSWIYNDSPLAPLGPNSSYTSQVLDIPIHVEVPDIVEVLQSGRKEFIVLDSASAKASKTGSDVRGRYSIIALNVDEALKLEYRTGDKHVTTRRFTSTQDSCEAIELEHDQTIWQLLAEFWTKRKFKADEVSSSFPFLGGFMGYTTYELGLEGIDVQLRHERRHSRPDLCFAWVTKSIVVDHLEGTLRIQHLSESDSADRSWLDTVATKLSSSSIWSDVRRAGLDELQPTPPRTPTTSGPVKAAQICVPDADEYEAKVRRCQDFIASGDSYELCLTDQTLITRRRSLPNPGPVTTAATITTPSTSPKHDNDTHSSAWNLYRALRARQPAPFGSYLCLGPATLISSSPERFLEYSASGLCSMRPMKGTVRKTTSPSPSPSPSPSSSPSSSPCASTLAQAEAILHVPKEEAENLMIVDLVRHDLHGVCGPGRVSVPRLLRVEEYASVFQMISVVEGQLPLSSSSSEDEQPDGLGHEEQAQTRKQGRHFTGLDVLAASLPPGSMTGAPKKRSCEILQGVEAHAERGLYSGVVGYMDVRGRGDWSVTIRSLFRWDDEPGHEEEEEEEEEEEVWHIGAGGAVTALSTPEGERDEMFTKLKGPLGVFEQDG